MLQAFHQTPPPGNRIDASDGLNSCLSRIQKLIGDLPGIDHRLSLIADTLGGETQELQGGKTASVGGSQGRPDTAVSVFVARQIEEDLREHMQRLASVMGRIEHDIG